jgi:antitoxin CptB
MKELDVVLNRYLDCAYQAASDADQAQFRALLEMHDPDLYNLLLGREATSDPERKRLLQKLRSFRGANFH